MANFEQEEIILNSTTGVVQIQDGIQLIEVAAVPGTAIAATQGRIWLKNDAPNTLYFTDDGGTDWLIGGTGAGTLAATLALGNTTGGTDITMSSGDSLIGATAATGVDVLITGGTSSTSGNVGGGVYINGGTNSSPQGPGGPVSIAGGNGVGTNRAGGSVQIDGGDGNGSAPGGSLTFTGGEATGSGGAGGAADFLGGPGNGAGAGGIVSVVGGGGGATGNGADLNLTSGTGGSTSGNAGDVVISSGTVTSGNLGVVHITNTALQFTEAAAVPGPAIAPSEGRHWVKSDAPNTPYFTDDAGTSYQIAFDPQHSRVNGDNGYGSTNTNIMRWDAETESNGGDITYADSAANGGSWTINKSGIYTISLSVENGAATVEPVAINVAAALSNTFDATHVRATATAGSTAVGDDRISVSWTGYVAATNVVWASSDGAVALATSTNLNTMTVARVA